MIDASKCSIKLKLVLDNQIKKAYVSFFQDETRQSGFVLKDGKFGLYLDPPKLPPKFIATYYDENKERFKKLQEAVVREYQEKVNSADTNGVEFTEKQLDDCWNDKGTG